jgi:23S rRNA (uridine2552-2'-O)-methyltransferase
LEEIDRRFRLFRKGQHVLDLGAAPGSWSMYASTRVGPSGRVLAVDVQLIDRELGPNVTVVHGDVLCLDSEQLQTFAPYHLVLSDMAPSTTGIREADHARSAELYQTALDVADQMAGVGAAFVGKLFMGEQFEALRSKTRDLFGRVDVVRPETTRRRSVELFLVGTDKRV